MTPKKPTTVSHKTGTRIMPHNSHRNRALWVTSDTVNRAPVLYNLP